MWEIQKWYQRYQTSKENHRMRISSALRLSLQDLLTPMECPAGLETLMTRLLIISRHVTVRIRWVSTNLPYLPCVSTISICIYSIEIGSRHIKSQESGSNTQRATWYNFGGHETFNAHSQTPTHSNLLQGHWFVAATTHHHLWASDFQEKSLRICWFLWRISWHWPFAFCHSWWCSCHCHVFLCFQCFSMCFTCSYFFQLMIFVWFAAASCVPLKVRRHRSRGVTPSGDSADTARLRV